MQYLIKDFHPAGGKPCVSNALKQVFHYERIFNAKRRSNSPLEIPFFLGANS